MAIFAEKVNNISEAIAKISPDPAERYAIASILVEMYRWELSRAFTPKEQNAT